MKTTSRISLAAATMAITCFLHAFDNAHFYRAPNFWSEPRFEKKHLTSFDILVAGGSTRQARNGCSDKTCLLNIYGCQNMRLLGAGVPCKNPSNPDDLVLMELEQMTVPPGSCFGMAQFYGKFKECEFDVQFTQNFSHGFFFQAQIPVRKLEIARDCCKTITTTQLCTPLCFPFEDLSPKECPCPDINNPVWQNFLHLFPSILYRYGLCLSPIHEIGAGDLSLLVGWTNNYQETDLLDFVDITVKCGILAPTGKKKNQDAVFSIPIGYNGHIGLPASIDAAIGSYEWLTLGVHLGAIIFLDRCYTMRLKTDCGQSGFIKLAKGCANEQEGTIVECGAYLKADHFVRGLSINLGYAYTGQHDTTLKPVDYCAFPGTVVNSDEMLKQWNMHSISFIAEYDFTKENSCFGPRIGFAYNLIVGGKRIFNTSTASGSFGFDLSWNFD